jgi:hypothetical protein
MARKDINFNTYVKRDLTKTTVDWGSVASKLTGDLLKVREDRAGQRAEIQKNTDETTAKLNEMEDYSNQSLQGLALGMSGDSANYLRVQNDLYKRGLITQTEFAQNKQRILGDWQQFGNISKRWESDYVKMVERAENGDASAFEIWFNEQNSEFGNLNNVKGMVNPDTGTLSLVRPNEDGSISKDPSRHVSMNTIQNRFNTQINNITKDGALDATLNKSVDGLGELIMAKVLVDKDGKPTEGVLTVEGQKQALASDDVQTYLNGTVNTILSNDYKTFSVLGDLVRDYEPTFDPAEAAADSKLVLVEYSDNTGVPKPVTDAPNWAKYDDDGKLIGGQKFVAQEALKNRLISMLDNKEAVKPGDVMTEYERERLALQREAMDKNTDVDNKNIDQDYEMIKYNMPRYDIDASKSELMGGKKPRKYLRSKLGEFIDTNNSFWLFNDSDNQVETVFDNIIQSVLDPNILKDLANDKYPGQKPFNLDFFDDGSDRLVMELGDKKITYPPLRSSNLLQQKTIDFDSGNYSEEVRIDKSATAEEKAMFIDESISPQGFYGVDTTGDGKIDMLRAGLNNYDEGGDGLNNSTYHNTDQMLDFVSRYLITPVDANLRDLQYKDYYGKDKNQKKETPLSNKKKK